MTAAPTETIEQLPIDRISIDQHNVRGHRPDLDQLVDSIADVGILVPLIVRPDGPDDWRAVDGGSRLIAAHRAGLTTVPCIVRNLDDDQAEAESLTANVARRTMNPIEEAHAYQRILDRDGWTQQTLAARVGVSQTHISHRLKLLQLDPQLQAKVASGEWTITKAINYVPKDPRRSTPHNYPATTRPRRTPAPRTAIAADLHDLDPDDTAGAPAAPRPHAPPGTTLVPIPNDLLDQARRRAAQAGIPLGAYIILAVRERLGRR